MTTPPVTKTLLDKAEKELRAEVVDTQPPAPESRIAFLQSNTTAAAGGRAMMPRRPALGRSAIRGTVAESEYLAAEAKEREDFIANDPVVQAAQNADSLAILSALKREVAKETASLAYQRQLNERVGRDSAPLSTRRIDALKKIADIELEMRKIGFDTINVRSEKFQRIVALWVETMREVAAAVLTPELLDLFYNRLTTEMQDWESKVDDLLR